MFCPRVAGRIGTPLADEGLQKLHEVIAVTVDPIQQLLLSRIHSPLSCLYWLRCRCSKSRAEIERTRPVWGSPVPGGERSSRHSDRSQEYAP